MSSEGTLVDVVIVGAGPAGATAAARLASQGHSVVMLDSARYPRNRVCAGWLSAQAEPLLAEMGLSLQATSANPFESVTFYNADLSKTARPKFDSAPGFLIDRTHFDHVLVKAAVAAGASFMDGCHVEDLSLQESSVELTLRDAGAVRGRLLMLAAGRGTPLMNRLGFGSGALPGGCWTAQVEGKDPGSAKQRAVAVILGIDAKEGFGVVTMSNGQVTIGVHSACDKQDLITSLVVLCRMAVEKKLLSVDLARKAAAAPVLVSPAAVALAMESHVAKHTLIVGDAGGFVSAVSGEGIYPAMWSARVASDVIGEALAAKSPQDVLMEFDTRWRMKMADHLRAPNTDTQYLLPLVFSNQPMADRMGAAFFSGENI